MGIIGRIREIWRYPVKSMGGEQLDSCKIGARGIVGDRGWALREEKVGEIQGAKKIPKLMLCAARYLEEPKDENIPHAEIRLPDGTVIRTDSSKANEILSKFLGRPVTLWPVQPASHTEHYRRNQRTDEASFRELLSRQPDEPLPDLTAFPQPLVEELFEYVSPLGTYFDVAPLHLLTTASVEALSSLIPGAVLDARRFRPNLYIETNDATQGFVEFDWCGKTIWDWRYLDEVRDPRTSLWHDHS